MKTFKNETDFLQKNSVNAFEFDYPVVGKNVQIIVAINSSIYRKHSVVWTNNYCVLLEMSQLFEKVTTL